MSTTRNRRAALLGMAAAAMLAPLIAAPAAHADRIVTVHEACNLMRPGTHAYMYGISQMVCVDPEYWKTRGTPFGSPTLKMEMGFRFPGAYPVNPPDRWSDWIIPGPPV